jgi:ubiquinone/menaquinone biosynthesis C-methylase UbiE
MGHSHGHGHGHGGHAHGHAGAGGTRDRFGNPEDLAEYMGKMESKDRDAWQKPDEIVAALGLKPGSAVAEIGAGIGYFSFRLSNAVGERGQVYAVEVEPRILDVLRERIESRGVTNICPIWGLGGDPLLPRQACDAILLVGVYHHFPDRPAMLARLARSLKPGGRIFNVDFDAGELPVGPPADHKVSREQFREEASRAGLRIAQSWSFLPYHYFDALEQAGG